MAELTVRCSWQPAGQIGLADGMLVFPGVPDAPGVYRFTVNDTAGVRVYVRESERLPGRFQHYRTPEDRESGGPPSPAESAHAAGADGRRPCHGRGCHPG